MRTQSRTSLGIVVKTGVTIPKYLSIQGMYDDYYKSLLLFGRYPSKELDDDKFHHYVSTYRDGMCVDYIDGKRV